MWSILNKFNFPDNVNDFFVKNFNKFRINRIETMSFIGINLIDKYLDAFAKAILEVVVDEVDLFLQIAGKSFRSQPNYFDNLLFFGRQPAALLKNVDHWLLFFLQFGALLA